MSCAHEKNANTQTRKGLVFFFGKIPLFPPQIPNFNLRIFKTQAGLDFQKRLNYKLLDDPLLKEKNKTPNLPIFNVSMPN